MERTLNRPGNTCYSSGHGIDILLKSPNVQREALPYATEARSSTAGGRQSRRRQFVSHNWPPCYQHYNATMKLRKLLQEAVSVFERNGNIHSQAVCCNQLGNIALHKGRQCRSRELFPPQRPSLLAKRQPLHQEQSAARPVAGLAQLTLPAACGIWSSTALADTIFSEQTARQLSNFRQNTNWRKKRAPHRHTAKRNPAQKKHANRPNHNHYSLYYSINRHRAIIGPPPTPQCHAPTNSQVKKSDCLHYCRCTQQRNP